MRRRIPLFTVAQGRFISQYDEEHARAVVVIGNAIADSLFPRIDPHRQDGAAERPALRSDRRVREGPGPVRRPGVDQFACIPLTNFHKNYPEISESG